ncbi:MAG: MtrB/PioB family decaheme-associated outer membrane protein, partial [Edaphobacter sp.]
NTAVSGIGSAHLFVPADPTEGSTVQLKTERQATAVGFNKLLPGGLELHVHFRNEEKDGARIFGRGNRLGPPGPSARGGYEFTPEPINSTIRRFGATVDYNGKLLQLSGGYYGTMYSNRNKALSISGGSHDDDNKGIQYAPYNFTPLALPPDNQSHQVFLSGGYTFTPFTRAMFKAAYTRATQTDTFLSTRQLAPGIGNNLGGRIDTILLQGGLSARPLPKLSLIADLRFEDRNDKTPVLLYNPAAARTDLNGNTWTGFNNPRSFRTLTGKLEANYALPAGFRAIGGFDYDARDRTGTPATTSHRNQTEELAFRVELRRSLSETVTGSISYIHADRSGSQFLTSLKGTGDPFFNLIAPFNLADRTRNRVRLLLNWQPIDPLSLQFLVEESVDNYGHRAGSNLGLSSGSARNYSLDATYAFSEAWQVTAWFSRNETNIDQRSRNPFEKNSREIWSVKLQDIGTAFGIGLNGRPNDKLEIGANLNYSDIRNRFRQHIQVDPATNSVPDISFQQGSFRLFTQYALQKNLGLRLDYILDRFKTDEWTWNRWKYTDGTQLNQNTNQLVSFIGVSAYYSWH